MFQKVKLRFFLSLLELIAVARQFLDDSLSFIQKHETTLANVNLENISFDEIVSQRYYIMIAYVIEWWDHFGVFRCKYFVKYIELHKDDHEVFIGIIKVMISIVVIVWWLIHLKNTDSAYLPVFLRQNISIKGCGWIICTWFFL